MQSEVDGYRGNCHKHFRTEEQAKQFIRDWEDAFAKVFMKQMISDLRAGRRPEDIGEFLSPLRGSGLIHGEADQSDTLSHRLGGLRIDA